MENKEQLPRKQIVVRMESSEIKDLKQFCLDNDMTISDAVKKGLALLKKEGPAAATAR